MDDIEVILCAVFTLCGIFWMLHSILRTKDNNACGCAQIDKKDV